MAFSIDTAEMLGAGESVMAQARGFLNGAKTLEFDQAAQKRTRDTLNQRMEEYRANLNVARGELDTLGNAIAILTKISDDTVGQSYEFIQESLNRALEKVFEHSERKINLREYTRGGAYPQLELEVITEGGVKRSLKDDSGHGISQIISLLVILSLIVITGQRRFLVLDEMLNGLSSNAAKVVSDILWAFADIGFQFVISEHGMVVKGSQVYILENQAGMSRIRDSYVEPVGVYLDGNLAGRKRRAEKLSEAQQTGEADEEVMVAPGILPQ